MITSSFEAMARLFDATLAELGDDEARPNVSPTETVPVCVGAEGDRALVPMRWGLVPPWYRAPNGGQLLINARAEGIATKPAFREAVLSRRCLIPADGFYEWQGEKRARTPWVIRPREGGIMAFAGLWQPWRGTETCAIVTCPANAVLAPIHDRNAGDRRAGRLRALARGGGAGCGAADGAGARGGAGGRSGGRGDAGGSGAAGVT